MSKVFKKINPFKKKGGSKKGSSGKKELPKFGDIMNTKEKSKKLQKKERKKPKSKKKQKEKKSDKLYKEYIERNLTRMKHNKQKIVEYVQEFFKNEKAWKIRAINPPEEILEKEIEMLLGEEEEWCSEIPLEVFDFRERFDTMHKDLVRTRIKKRTFELNRYFTLEPDYKSERGTVFQVKVFISEETLKLIGIKESIAFDNLSITFNAEMNGFELCRMFLDEVNKNLTFTVLNSTEIQKRVSLMIFKVCGKSSYLFGGEKLLDYQEVRDVLARADPILKVIAKNKLHEIREAYEREERLYFQILEEIQYDFCGTFDQEDKRGPRQGINVRRLAEPLSINLGNFFNKDLSVFENSKVDPKDCGLFIVCEILHGERVLSKKFSKCCQFQAAVAINQEIEFSEILLCDIPRETVIQFSAWGRVMKKNDPMVTSTDGSGRVEEKDFKLGTTVHPLVDYKGELTKGNIHFFLQKDSYANVLTFGHYENSDQSLMVKFPDFKNNTVFFPRNEENFEFPQPFYDRLEKWEVAQAYKHSRFSGRNKEEIIRKEVDAILSVDPLSDLDERQKWILWDARDQITDIPELLPYFLLSVPYQFPPAVQECHRMLEVWARISKETALELLDYKYMDTETRRLSLRIIDEMANEELLLYLLQLVNALKFELYHNSPLTRWLLQRALRNPIAVGHYFYWYLRSEMEESPFTERCGVIAEEFLKRCGSFRMELLKMTCLNDQLLHTALQIKELKGVSKEKKEERNQLLLKLIDDIWVPPRCKLALFDKLEVSGIQKKGKVMSSKKLPLILFFDNADKFEKEPVVIMFKAGDDLRQDLLTLQMFRIMDNLWKENNLDFLLKIYGCMCTGYMTGMLEIVTQSETVADIVKEKGVLKKDAIIKWLREKNQGNAFVSNFLYSCAGYCVATYALGIGDRHNDNVMLKENGNLFHIDFGHFLGHRKKFLGVKRETSPFVFTQQYCAVIGGPEDVNFTLFQQITTKAFLHLRKKSNLMMVLFLLMLGCGIPELKDKRDVQWMKDCLVLNLDNHQASEYFKILIDGAMGNIRQKLNDTWHVLYHKYL